MTHRPPLELAALEDRLALDATALDLTARGSSGWIGEAFFTQFDARPTGTGYIQSFLRVQGASAKGVTQQGYNTDARPLQYDENKSPKFTRALHVSEVPTVNVGGSYYKEFLLDINQKASQPLLSLDQLRFYVGGAGNLRGYDPATKSLAGLTPVYDLDAGGDNWVKLDYRLNTGSGSGDMLVYVPVAAFAGGEYVYLYSKFGEHHAANSGFQEWARGTSESVNAPTFATVSGTIFNDFNQNGTRDVGEPGVPNVIVYQDANGNGYLDDNEAWTVTGDDGSYKFPDLLGGQSYTLRAVLDIDSGASTNGLSVFVAAGEDVTGADIGIFRNQT